MQRREQEKRRRRRRLILAGTVFVLAACAGVAAAAVLHNQTDAAAPTTHKPPPKTHPPITVPAQTTGTTTPTTQPASTQSTSTSSTSTVLGKPLAGKVILIDPGHNIHNYEYPNQVNAPVAYGPPGATKPCDTTGTSTDNGYSEAEYNLTVGLQVVSILRHWGANVTMTPVNKVPWGPCITQRAALGNDLHANAAVSIHADGAPASAHGFYVIVPDATIPNVALTAGMIANDDNLGAAMLRGFHAVTGMPVSNEYSTGYLRSNDYGGTDLSHVPKIFIETGNMRNAGDAALMETPSWRAKAALGIATGIRDYLTGR